MLQEVLRSLNLKPGDTVVDATLGGGGHAREILKAISPGGRLIGIDADETALEKAAESLKGFDGSFTLIRGNFREVEAIMSREGTAHVDGALFDLGVSSYQLESPARGFSMMHESRLDMRMDTAAGITAYDVVNRYSERDLSALIQKFGEERFHRRIANAIVYERAKRKIETTHDLVRVIHKAVGSRYRKSKIDPATRTFQAIRIAVNDELGALEEGLRRVIPLLNPEARIAVISFHSLEDRIVKHLFREYSKNGILKIITKKPALASEEEVRSNPRSRSAKLRVAEKS
jgi:16S rRNA (cytosine1402-N4)-methyltransferase